MSARELANAVAHLAAQLGRDTAGDVAPSLCCSELDALVRVFRAGGHADTAASWLEAHAWSASEEPGDCHYSGGDACYRHGRPASLAGCGA